MILMSHRRSQQLRRAGERASRGRRSPTLARRLPAVPPPRTTPTTARPVTLRQAPADPEGNSQPDVPQQHGLDWARRIELVAVVLGVLLSSLIAAVGIWYSNDQVSQEMGIAQQGQITDRYTKAVENLGDDAMDVRLGGIYALQRIMEDSSRDHPTVADVLATYVRTHANKPPKSGDGVPADLHAAVTILTHRDTTRDKAFYLDLRGTHLPGVELWPRRYSGQPADLSDAVLTGAKLRGAKLLHANLSGASLSGVELSGADLQSADLSEASLPSANLSGADLAGVDLTRANLLGAKLTRVNLSSADLTGAALVATDLSEAILADADLRGANMSGADLTGADLQGTDLTDTILADVDLTEANLYSDTKLPPHLARDPDIKARIAELEEKIAKDH
ncbi:pentapeptide repeat-containing protein [Streptomyces phaeochromogenes]|uniref:pentapeptide repeat-containing protein n=1 Tax=Streptomyces phaeochromogenes TaxID=1923 RepID=UPI002E127710|nr:pentapeptide repeat-containing protein [Streptomyces phaeochromogenes]